MISIFFQYDIYNESPLKKDDSNSTDFENFRLQFRKISYISIKKKVTKFQKI